MSGHLLRNYIVHGSIIVTGIAIGLKHFDDALRLTENSIFKFYTGYLFNFRVLSLPFFSPVLHLGLTIEVFLRKTRTLFVEARTVPDVFWSILTVVKVVKRGISI